MSADLASWHLNGLDVVLLVWVMWCGYRGYKKGLVAALLGLIAWIMALILGSALAKQAAPAMARFADDPAVQLMLGFIAVALLVVVMIKGAGILLSSLLNALALGFAERLAGSLFGMVKALVIVLVILSVVDPWARVSPLWKGSRTIQTLVPYAPVAEAIASSLGKQAWRTARETATEVERRAGEVSVRSQPLAGLAPSGNDHVKDGNANDDQAKEGQAKDDNPKDVHPTKVKSAAPPTSHGQHQSP